MVEFIKKSYSIGFPNQYDDFEVQHAYVVMTIKKVFSI